MDLAIPGEIKRHCDPNGLSSFQEYLSDYASEETAKIGAACIETALKGLGEDESRKATKMVNKVRSGDRDVFC